MPSPNLTLRELAAAYEMSAPALLRYQRKGVDLMDPKALVDAMARGDRPSPVFDKIRDRIIFIRRELAKAVLRRGGDPEVFGLPRC
jgi:hypothetical protein